MAASRPLVEFLASGTSYDAGVARAAPSKTEGLEARLRAMMMVISKVTTATAMRNIAIGDMIDFQFNCRNFA